MAFLCRKSLSAKADGIFRAKRNKYYLLTSI